MEEKINILSRVDLGFIVRQEVDIELSQDPKELNKTILKEVFRKIKRGEIGKVDFRTKKYI